jgi:excisionase family DNA binding protein
VPAEELLAQFADMIAERLVEKIGGPRSTRPSVAPRLMSIGDAAAYLGRSKHSLQHLVSQRRIPFVRDGRRIFLDACELDRWIRDNTEEAQG